MKVLCSERFEQAKKFAESRKDQSLEQCIERLKSWERNGAVIELYADFAPYSFGFTEIMPDGTTGLVGGLLYHGEIDESFAVQIEPHVGWSIHT